MTITHSENVLHIAGLLQQNPLFVFALDAEAAEEFKEVDPLIIGIGKVNAAYYLTKKIMENKPGIIVNLGSAGSTTFKRGEVVCCTTFIQRDMDVTGLGFKMYETPLSGQEPVLSYGLQLEDLRQGICGTGDNFETAHTCTDYNVLDMEAYPLAFIAMKEQIPFLCLKYISDGADGTAAEEWLVTVHHAATAFKKIITALTSLSAASIV
jgi:adenosylhomocysteine nucleosidase